MVILDHVGRLQVLMLDRVVLAHQRQSPLVVKVLALALHFEMRFGEHRHRFTPAIAPFLAATDTPLRHFQRPFGLPIPARVEDARAV